MPLSDVIRELGGRNGLRDDNAIRFYRECRQFARGERQSLNYRGSMKGFMRALRAAALQSESPVRKEAAS